MLRAEETAAFILQHKTRLCYPLKAVWSPRKDEKQEEKETLDFPVL